jgi:putative resolvase
MPVPVVQTPSGRWLVTVPEPGDERVVAYCRVSPADQKDDLERQAGRVAAGATARGLAVSLIVSEVGSGVNGHRRKLTRVLSDPSATVIVVEHRDRLTRFGFEHLAASLAASGRRIVVLDEAETTDDLVRDVTEVLTSLCARLYGRRSASRRAAKAVAVATGRAGGEGPGQVDG